MAAARAKRRVEQCCPSVLTAVLDDDEAADLGHAFAALGDPVRLKLLSLIAAAPAGELCACDLIAPLHKSQRTISHHTKILVEAGLITAEKRGRWVWYRVEAERLASLRTALG